MDHRTELMVMEVLAVIGATTVTLIFVYVFCVYAGVVKDKFDEWCIRRAVRLGAVKSKTQGDKQ